MDVVLLTPYMFMLSRVGTLQRFLAPLQKHPWLTTLLIIKTLIWSWWGVLLIYINTQIIAATELWNHNMLTTYVWYFVALTIVTFSTQTILSKYEDVMLQNVVKNTALDHMQKMVHIDNNAFETMGTWYINSVLKRGVDTWASLLLHTSTSWLDAWFQILLALIIIMQSLGRYGAIIVAVLMSISLVTMHVGTRMSMPHRRERRKLFGMLDKDLVRLIMSKFEVLINNKITQEQERLARQRDRVIDARHKDWNGIIVAYFTPRMLAEIMRGIIYVYVWLWVLEGRFTIADFVLLIMIIELLRHALGSLTAVYRQYAQDFLYVKRLWNMFDHLPEMQGVYEGQPFVYQAGNIELRQVTYTYTEYDIIDMVEQWKDETEQKSMQVFDAFDLQIMGGKKTALVWLSWSWKTTLVKLIAGYLRPTAGSVWVDQQNLTDVSLASYYTHIGYLTQEPSVFDGTIRENLLYAIPHQVPHQQIHHVLQQAKCDFVITLPDGLDTMIGERGIRLSWWQRQRLAIAKIMLKNPEIILLDEPTSALDSFSEEAVSEAMSTLFVGRTVIIIAHRLQTVRDADEIIVLEEGQVKERGTHGTLIERGWTYACLLDLQSW